MSILNAVASVAVNDMNAALQWYEKVLGRHPIRGRCQKSPSGNSNEADGYRSQAPCARAGSGSVTLAVSSIDDQLAQLNTLGIDTGEGASSDKVRQ
jgi:hypothetical protein